jgi:hypothetical protein
LSCADQPLDISDALSDLFNLIDIDSTPPITSLCPSALVVGIIAIQIRRAKERRSGTLTFPS